ncbi:uncharacterized protein LOC117302180 [Asterias rubens]|uniref:uncharacterized protein LOC117302180 n=1 Tax=Asterias rubens TaxID=7604 RepID=UPI001454FE61|nr:uncharacterized protein LOC117302180 [Asterias rubens]
MNSTPPIHQLRMDSSDSSCSNRTRSIASLGGSEDSILEEREPPTGRGEPGRVPRLSDGFSPDEQDSGFNSTSQLECSSPRHNGTLRCRTPEIKPHRHEESADDVWLPRFPRAKKLGTDRMLGTSGSLGSTDSWIENSVSEEEEDMDDTDIARCLTSMSMGSGVIKVNGSGRCAVKTLFLDGNKSCVRWRPSKKGSKAKINIESIKEIREGLNTDTFKKYLASGNKCNPKSAFSIIHGTSWETLDLISDTEEEIIIWLRGLKHLMRGMRSEIRRLNNNKLRDSWLKATFEAADKSGDGLLSMDEVLKLLHKLNVNLSKRKVKQLFKEADSQDDNIGKLDFEEFIHFYRTISTRQEVDLLLSEYGNGKGYMTPEEFAKYLKEEQGLADVELDMCQELVQTYEPIPENAKNGWMGIDGFTSYLLSHEGDIFNPAHREVNQDMTRPLSHYYIASSHNTYLVGDQLMSQSSVDVYALVLQSGCRCVEMDCWDGKDGEPIIYHGYTLTSKIKFRDVISIISKYAFVTSPYPVILSIENHCNLEQQKKMALYLIEILGEMLHIPPINSSKISLPSPEELKGKILIKAKKLPVDHNENLEAGEVSEEDSADELDDDFKLETSSISKKFESVAMAQLMLMRKKPITPTRSAWQRIVSKVREDSRQKNAKNHARSSSLTGTLRRLKLAKKKPKSQSSSESSEGGSLDLLEKPMTDEESAGDQPSTTTGNPKTPSPQPVRRSHKGKSIVLSRKLSELVQLTRSVGFRGFKAAMLSWELPSLGEIRASNLVATKAPDFVQFTANHMCRVYPSAYRIDSSNYNPQPMWNCGCQLVALNYQTEGRPMQLSRARFSVNGNSGYALKHALLCDESKPFDPNSGDPVSHLPKKQLTIHVISGQQLPKPPQSLLGERGEIIDPYVEVEVIGLPVDCAKAQTKTIQDNGFNPFWDCTMTFTLHLADTALIRFAVWDEDPIGRDFIGQATFAVSSLMPGYRHVHLEGLDQATLFVHVTLEDYNSWLNSTARFRPRGSHCRTKSMELEYSPLSSSPTHRLSPRRKSSLGIVQKLNMRRRHSMAALPARELSPLPFGTRMKRRSYEDGNLTGSAGELRPVAEELSEYYLELTLTCTDTILHIISNSHIPTSLELNGSISISVDDLPDVFALNIPPSALFRAIQEHKLSLRSEESYTAVESFATLTELWRSQRQQELDYDSLSVDSDSMASSMNYDQFVQDVFEDCFTKELTYDPRPDLLKEASPSHDSSSSGIDKQGPPQDVSSDDVMSQDTVSSVGISSESESQNTGTSQKAPSDQGSDDVFLPDVSKQVCPVDQLVVEECFQKVVTLPQLKIPKLSLVSSPIVSPVPNSPSSPRVCTFTRDAVQRRSRIIYDDTAEFIVQPCSDSEIVYRSVSERTSTLSQKRLSSMSITGSFLQEFDNMLQKYQEESPDSTIENDTLLGQTNVQGIPAPEEVLTTLDSASDTSLNCPDVISNSPSTALVFSSPRSSDYSDDETESDISVTSDIISADSESNQPSELHRTTSKEVPQAIPNTNGGYHEITSLTNKCNLPNEIQGLTRSQNLTNHLDGVNPKTPTIIKTLKLDEEDTEIKEQKDLTLQNDRNNNRGISLQMLKLIQHKETLKSHCEKINPKDDVMREFVVEDSVRLMDDSVGIKDRVVSVDMKNCADVRAGVGMDDNEHVDGLVDIDEGVDIDDSVTSFNVDASNGVNVVDVRNEADMSESVDTKYDVEISNRVGINERVDVDNGVDVNESEDLDLVYRVENDRLSDGDSDDTSSTASLSSVPSSVSSSDTVVEVPSSFPGKPRDPTDNISPDLSPLRLEDIFNPSECKQFRSEFVQHWQQNVPEHKSTCKTGNPSAQFIPGINQAESCKPPAVIPGNVMNGPRPYSNKAKPISAIQRDLTQRTSSASDKNNSHTNPKRLSWPPIRQKVLFLDKGKVDFKPNVQNGTLDNERDGRIIDCGADSAGKGLIKPNFLPGKSTQGKSSLHVPNYTEGVFTSQLSQIRLSRPGSGQQQSVSTTTTTLASAGTYTHVLPSYHDHGSQNGSQKPADPTGLRSPTDLRSQTGLRSPTGKALPERMPPSYEDHISRYGIPANRRPIPTARQYQPDSSPIKFRHAEPVQVPQVDSASRHHSHGKRSSRLLEGDTETLSSPEPESEANQIHSKPVQMYNCCTWPYKSAASPKTLQLHPTPPRRRKKLPDRCSETEECAPPIHKNLGGRKSWPLKSEKGHNVYLMLTL